MAEAEQILSDPDRLTCDKTHCNMTRSDCIASQKKAADEVKHHGCLKITWRLYRCINCEQGKRVIEIKKLKEKGIIVPIKKEEIKRDPEGQSIKEDEKHRIILDFSEHIDLLEKIVAEAGKKFRNPRGQIMAIVNRYFDDLKGLKQ